MAFSKFITVVAALAVTGGNAMSIDGPVTPESHSKRALTARDWSCTLNDAPAEGLICNKDGYINEDWRKFTQSVGSSSLETCADACVTTAGCTAMNYDTDKTCYLFIADFSSFIFTELDLLDNWYQLDCFSCTESVQPLTDGDEPTMDPSSLWPESTTVLNIDFEDYSILEWFSLNTITSNEFFMDILVLEWFKRGEYTNALTIFGNVLEAWGTVTYNAPLKFEAGYYVLDYALKANGTVEITDLPDWWTLNFIIADGDVNNANIILEDFSKDGIFLGNGWWQFQKQFQITNADADYWLSMSVYGAGEVARDWYLDDLSIQRVF